MIEFVKGNFFDYEADIRINTVNCVGVMGAGVALLFKNKFPNMYNNYVEACSKNEIQPGKPHIWHENTFFSPLTIINFPTKLNWKNPSEYIYIEKGLIWLREFLLNNTNKTITIPALGCGHGGLDWNIVKEMIKNHLENINCRILVFEPASSTISKISNDLLNDLVINNIHSLYPNDTLYPKKMKGRSSVEILYKGNLDLLSKKTISILVNSKPEDREINALNSFIDELPNKELVFLLGFSNSHEIDITKKILLKGYNVIINIPYGIFQLKIRKDLQNIINEKNSVIISTTSPNQAWKMYESINSLKFRLKIADVTLINSLHFEKFEKFESEFKSSDTKKFYLNYWKNKIDFFDRISAFKIGVNPNTKKPNTFNLINTI